MILADTTVWIDHFRRVDVEFIQCLEMRVVGGHDLVIEELALGTIPDRSATLASLENLHSFPNVSHEEMMALIRERKLYGRGIGAVDARLLSSVLIAGGCLWTRDKRLKAIARELGVSYD